MHSKVQASYWTLLRERCRPTVSDRITVAQRNRAFKYFASLPQDAVGLKVIMRQHNLPLADRQDNEKVMQYMQRATEAIMLSTAYVTDILTLHSPFTHASVVDTIMEDVPQVPQPSTSSSQLLNSETESFADTQVTETVEPPQSPSEDFSECPSINGQHLKQLIDANAGLGKTFRGANKPPAVIKYLKELGDTPDWTGIK